MGDTIGGRDHAPLQWLLSQIITLFNPIDVTRGGDDGTAASSQRQPVRKTKAPAKHQRHGHEDHEHHEDEKDAELGVREREVWSRVGGSIEFPELHRVAVEVVRLDGHQEETLGSQPLQGTGYSHDGNCEAIRKLQEVCAALVAGGNARDAETLAARGEAAPFALGEHAGEYAV